MLARKIADFSSESPLDRTPVQDRLPAKLTPHEVWMYGRMKTIVARGIKAFAEIAEALKTIRNAKLFRADYPDFETYCRAELPFGASRARQLIGAIDVAADIAEIQAKPVSEIQMRPLRRLDSATRKQVWREASQRETVPTERTIKAVIHEMVRADPDTRVADADMAVLVDRMVKRMRRTVETVETWEYAEGLNADQETELDRLIRRARQTMNEVQSQLG